MYKRKVCELKILASVWLTETFDIADFCFTAVSESCLWIFMSCYCCFGARFRANTTWHTRNGEWKLRWQFDLYQKKKELTTKNMLWGRKAMKWKFLTLKLDEKSCSNLITRWVNSAKGLTFSWHIWNSGFGYGFGSAELYACKRLIVLTALAKQRM